MNDHMDFRWDDRVIGALGAVGHRLASVIEDLSAVLARFAGYSERYTAALSRVQRGEQR